MRHGNLDNYLKAIEKRKEILKKKICFLKILFISQNSTGKILREKSSLRINLVIPESRDSSLFSSQLHVRRKTQIKKTKKTPNTQKNPFSALFHYPPHITAGSERWTQYILYSKIKVNQEYFVFLNRFLFVNLFVCFLYAPEAALSSLEIE